MRLRKPAEFDAVKAARVVKYAGPLRVGGRPNGLGHHRLGLAVSKRAGSAVQRNAIKRRVREAFRLLQHELPGAYDLVVSAKAHDIAGAEAYQRWLGEAVLRIDRQWRKQSDNASD